MRQTDYVILGLLEDEPMTGYEIKKLIDIRFKFFWSESFGQIFPALKNLLNLKLIEELQGDSNTKRKKKIYKITQKGKEELKNWLILPVEKETVRFEILVKMYFSKLVDSSFMIDHINDFMKKHNEDLFILNLFSEELKKIEKEDPSHGNILKVIDFGQKLNKAYLTWGKETISYLERRDLNETKN